MKELDLYKDIHKLKHTERKGWKDREIPRPMDTIASHSFGAALIGWVLAENAGEDSDKVVKRLLLHDLVMSYSEDMTPENDDYDRKSAIERSRLDLVKATLPDSIKDEASKMLDEEFEREKSSESQIAKEADKLDTILQAIQYEKETGESFAHSFIDFYEEEFESDEGLKMLNRIKDSHQ